MKADDFTSARAGRLIITPQGYAAYVPRDLPPELSFDWSLARAVAEAERALGNLSGIGSTLPNPHLLIRPFMQKEAVLSSRIEGTQASLSDLFFFEAAGAPERDQSDVREVANYVRALELGLMRVKDLPVSQRLLREMHAVLMQGARGDEVTPGEFRETQNWIGASRRLEDAIFVPPPAGQMRVALGDLERFLHEPSDLPFLVWLALIHYQFEAIHPFRDGNGRIGRLLLVLLLCVHGVLREPLLYLSAYFERHRTTYYDLLLRVSQKGEWEAWIRFFCTAVEEQSRDAVSRAMRLNALLGEFRRRLQSARASALLLRTVEELFRYPAVTIPGVKSSLGVTYRTAQQIVDRLTGHAILTEVTGQSRNRIYYAPEIVAIIEG
jgi:Fic family protein